MKTTAPADADALSTLMRGHDDWRHLAVKARGRFLTIVALDGQAREGQALARLELLQHNEYGLAIMWHNDRWQRLPVSGTLGQLVEMLRQEFGALLAAF
jgi:hypothetical protein